MQFHHHGYVSGDPRVQPAAGVGLDRPAELPDEIDVLIVGTGPAGMIAAAQLAQFPGITTRIIERRAGRLVIGQADGIQARSVETFQAFGFAGRITEEAYRITEMSFWKPDPADPRRIVIFDSPPALAASPASVLAAHVGQVMMVVRADATGESDLREAVQLLDGCDHLQLVLNAVSYTPGGARFGSYYGQEEGK